MEPSIASQQVKILNDLITALRQLSIYPPHHPIITESIKNAFISVQLLLGEVSGSLEIGISPDGKISLNGEALPEKGAAAGEIKSFMQKLEVEGLVFVPGLTLEEMDTFIRTVADPETVKKNKDLKGVLAGKGVEHVIAKQFSYLKVEKGAEVVRLEEKIVSAKTRVKESLASALPETVLALEEEVFHLAGEELKDRKKLGAEIKSLLKTFLKRYPDRDLGFQKLREVLLGQGTDENEVGQCLTKLSQDMDRAGRRASAGAGAREREQELKHENEQLKAEIERLRQSAEESHEISKNLETENVRIFGEKKRIDSIIHNLGEGMVVVDPQGKIMLVNSTAENLLGITSADIGKYLKDVVKDEHLLTLSGAGDAGKGEKDIEVMSQNETTRKVVRASSAVIEDNNGNTVGMVTMLNDITKQKELERLKSDFLANVSHELRTPLISVDKSVKMLLECQGGEISSTQQELLAIASRNLKRLTGMINSLLDLTKLEARRMELHIAPVSMGKLIDECFETIRPLAESKSLTLARSVPELPPINADHERLLQVLINLTANAVKFTPVGGTITVEAASSGSGMTFSVSDTGPGIPQQDLEKIFDKFYQTKERPSSDICGTGIGLALVREIVTLHGGTVRAESGRGAKFTVSLPCEAPCNVSSGG